MVDPNTYALLSTRVYEASVGKNEIFLPTGWTELPGGVDNGLTGLYARAYQNGAGEVVIAFRGTDTDLTDGFLADALADDRSRHPERPSRAGHDLL